MIDPARVVLSVISPYPELRIDPLPVVRAVRSGEALRQATRLEARRTRRPRRAERPLLGRAPGDEPR
jgi:hypothetical protein